MVALVFCIIPFIPLFKNPHQLLTIIQFGQIADIMYIYFTGHLCIYLIFLTFKKCQPFQNGLWKSILSTVGWTNKQITILSQTHSTVFFHCCHVRHDMYITYSNFCSQSLIGTYLCLVSKCIGFVYVRLWCLGNGGLRRNSAVNYFKTIPAVQKLKYALYSRNTLNPFKHFSPADIPPSNWSTHKCALKFLPNAGHLLKYDQPSAKWDCRSPAAWSVRLTFLLFFMSSGRSVAFCISIQQHRHSHLQRL